MHTINITLQTCHSISRCIQAARHAEKDEKYELCGLPNGGEELQRSVRMRTETWLGVKETEMMISNLWRSLGNERISHQ